MALATAVAAGSWKCREIGAGQEGATNYQQPSGGLHFETTAIEMGEIRSGLPFSCQFPFANAGKNTVELVEARPGCGCLKPRLEQCHFNPGERGAIPLEAQTLGQAAGPHTWHLTVLYRDGDRVREQALEISATVVTEVSVQPASLTLFTDGVLSHDITVIDLRPEPLQILDVQTTSPHLHAEPGPFIKDGFGNFACKVKVETAAELPAGRHDELLIIHTNDPLYREFKIAITVVKRASRSDK
jgi:hypothetical protein